MRHTLAISAVALAIASLATPGEAQTFNRNGGQQRSFGGPSQNSGFSQRAVRPQVNTNVGNRTFRSVQPPAPGGQVGNVGNRSFRSVQPPAPGGNQAGNQAGNARSFSIQPPPGGGATRSAQPPIGNTIQPPIAAPAIPTATATAATVGSVTATAAGVTAAPPSSAHAAQPGTAAAGNDTAQVGQPIDPAANTGLPPLEMLATIGEPIMPLAQAPATPVAGATQTAQPVVARVVRTTVATESCGEPVYHVPHHHYRSYRRW